METPLKIKREILIGHVAIEVGATAGELAEQTTEIARNALAQNGQLAEANNAHPFVIEPGAYVVLVWADERLTALENRVRSLETLARIAARMNPVAGVDVEKLLGNTAPPIAELDS